MEKILIILTLLITSFVGCKKDEAARTSGTDSIDKSSTYEWFFNMMAAQPFR